MDSYSYNPFYSFFLDCGDNSDEMGCTTNSTAPPATIDEPIDTDICLRNQFMCDTGRCISKAYVCDGFPDCSGSEDETNCPKNICSRDKFRCRSDGVCLDKSKYCDGKINLIIRRTSYYINNCSLTIFLNIKGVPNCVDGSDEDNCHPPPLIP